MSRMTEARRFDGVLFDVGGTLWTADGASRVRNAAERLGVSVDVEEAARLWSEIAADSRSSQELAKGRDLNPTVHRKCWLDLLRPADCIAPGMAELLYEDEFRPESFLPYPDVGPTLQRLQESGVRLGVVSDVGHDIRGHLEYHGLLGFFQCCVLSFEHGAVKPEPHLFLAACDELGVRPNRCLMVGDTPHCDGGAVDAGLTALVLPPVPAGRPRGLEACLAMALGLDPACTVN